ncbi:MAG: hypothetical protein GY861_20685 [bacterium]|nr:hypothetical protein [bacterium]
MGRPKKTAADNKVKTIGELQLKVITETIKLLEKIPKIPSQVKEIKEQVKEIEDSFAYEIQEKEVVTEEKKKALDEELIQYQSAIEEKKDVLDEELAEKDKQYARLFEQAKYNHTITIRDEDLNTSKIVASKYNMCIVGNGEWSEVNKLAETNEEKISSIVESAKQETERSIKSTKDAEIRNLKHSYELKTALASKDVENLQREVEALRGENARLRATIDRQNENIVRVAEAATRPANVLEGKNK